MSDEEDAVRSPMWTADSTHPNSDYNESLDDAVEANNSIIGIVKSRVTGMLPNNISRWFTTSTRNESVNGSLGSGTRRRRRAEIDNDSDDAEEDEVLAVNKNQIMNDYNENVEPRGSEDNNVDDSNNSAEAIVANSSFNSNIRRDVLRPNVSTRPPPSKRSRLNLDITAQNIRDVSIMQCQPLSSSTPTLGANPYAPSASSVLPGNATGRYGRISSCSKQNRLEPALNVQFSPVTEARERRCAITNATAALDTISEHSGGPVVQNDISSRSNLNITSSALAHRGYAGLGDLKRQSLSSVRQGTSNTSTIPRCSKLTAEVNVIAGGNRGQVQDAVAAAEEEEEEERDINDADVENEREGMKSCNGGDATDSVHKGRKLMNGAGNLSTTTATRENNSIRDSASESSDGGVKVDDTLVVGEGESSRRIGLYNTTMRKSRNNSCTSSYGNGLNFYTHLEGRKSLFAGKPSGNVRQGLNNSTLSLNSLNRRQFNPSIYGSTSALSDSRLLNTFSPFYKGKTTYGGAAAYNKYSTSAAIGAAPSSRLTPTLMRPTSSLSTLSSSNNSVAGASTNIVDNPSGLSSTAKQILELINDFSTPLSEAKKMANTLKVPQVHQQLRGRGQRFSEADLNTMRAARLSQVATPYTRPSITLQPTVNAKQNTIVPPVRELQVPSMSQIMQLKRLQTTTERSRQIASENDSLLSQTGSAALSQYTLPVNVQSNFAKQQKHTNKMKNKITASVRTTGSKESNATVTDNLPPPAVCLSNIAFPLMESVPTFDISIPNATVTKLTTPEMMTATTNAPLVVNTTNAELSTSDSVACDLVRKSNSTTLTAATTTSFKPVEVSSCSIMIADATKIDTKPCSPNFIFSNPTQLNSVDTSARNVTPIKDTHYKFSAPATVSGDIGWQLSNKTTLSQGPTQLKSGSVLDALKSSPFNAPTRASGGTVSMTATAADTNKLTALIGNPMQGWECSTCLIRNKDDASRCIACESSRRVVVTSTIPSLSTTTDNVLRNHLKRTNEWECDTCMIRNKIESTKCVACEGPRKDINSRTIASPMLATGGVGGFNSKNTFGDAFQMKKNTTWECAICLIKNDLSAIKCVACECKRSHTVGAAVAPVDGGTTATTGISTTNTSSKWECEACMTYNEASRMKCVCCEHAKPGSINENLPKFSFGSAAANKFTFGFSSASEEVALRKGSEASMTRSSLIAPIAAPVATGFTLLPPSTSSSSSLSVSQPTMPVGGVFTFGSKDTVDKGKIATPTTSSIGAFITTTSTSSLVVSTSTTTASTAVPAIKASSGVILTKSSNNAFTLPVFNSPPKEDAHSTNVATTTITTSMSSMPITASLFGSSNSTIPIATQASESPKATQFSFALTKQADVNKTTGGFPCKTSISSPTTTAAPAAANITGGFTFGAGAIATNTTKATSSEGAKLTFNFTRSSGSATTLASPKIASAPDTAVVETSTATSVAAAATNVPSMATFFGNVTKTTTVATSCSVAPPVMVTPSTTVSPNVFDSFGNSASATASSGFGMPSNTLTTSAPTFGRSTFASGNASETAQPRSSTFAPIFGAATTANTLNSSTVTQAAGTAAWQRNNFEFGSGTAATTSSPSSILNADNKPSSSFGGFRFMITPPVSTTTSTATAVAAAAATTTTTSSSAPSFFGNMTGSSAATFGNVSGTTPIFGSSPMVSTSTTPAAASSSNLFSSSITPHANPLGGGIGVGAGAGGAPQQPAFGSSLFGNSPKVEPTAMNTFGDFGKSMATAPKDDTITTNKTADAPFNFGLQTATSTLAQNPSGEFKFNISGCGPSTTETPAFNFGSTANQPAAATFNFTASAEAPKSVPAFQFGATSFTTPVFNFSAGSVEQTQNASFQFNASNIFAPQPTPAAQSSQIRRKIRTPIRRLTPR